MKKDGKSRARSVAVMGVMAALALIFGYIETLIPFNFGLPGVKLGLANLAVVACLYVLPLGQALGVALIKALASSLLFGNAYSLAYSLCGGLVSFAAMAVAMRLWRGRLGVVGVSIVGGLMHNVGQLAVAAAVLETLRLAYYLPVLLASGAVTGLLIGLAAGRALPLVEKAVRGSKSASGSVTAGGE